MTSLTKTLLVSLALIFGVAGLISGVMIFKNYQKDKLANKAQFISTEVTQPESTSSASTPIVTVTPTPTPEPKEYTVAVLNGSGIPGEAGRVQSLLEEGDLPEFTSVTAGNADGYDYTASEVHSKEELPAGLIERIKTALAEYDVIVGDPLTADAENDIEIIVGQTK
ncbi:hypothetical protein COT52_01145 [candidate division WWE3 bacterium CG08_land_8_20_14_0_20_43_13]|uniref:LytR/CpsA/Psr regulator C-terminal domain-containing protein n=1 Tax=candidate division WWE3 bacterium CG08_land_8_20_14_0_20_43_13 TaxID=1975087 RepID=A0A2H0X9V4_UNCKA|nr:MAG: hypothetical protein COT52_01145 [candidate division WWE3 bacterium CG08_land_8_20_14_0_20_43_13]